MGVLSFIQDVPTPELDSIYFPMYLTSVLCGLCILRRFSIVGRPVVHPDRKLGSKHKAAEAERVEILERLNSGSKVGDHAPSKAGHDLHQLLSVDLSDVEKEPLCAPLQNSSKEANEATITLSGGRRFPSKVYESMKEVSEAAACGEFNGDDSVLYNSETTMLQTKVELHDGTLERLKELVQSKDLSTSRSSDGSTPILQVDNWAILKKSDKGNKGINLLRLPVDTVPVILHAEYAAGLLTITGLNLEDASILVSGQHANYTVNLKVLRFLKGTEKKWNSRQPWGAFSDTEEDIVSLPLRLYWTEVEDVFVYATKKVQLGVDGKSVDAMSKAVRVTHGLWKTVLGLWIPCIALWIFTIYNMMGLLRSMPSLKENFEWSLVGANGGLLMLWTLILFHKPSTWFAESVKYHVENMIRVLGQGVLLFYYGFKSLRGPRMKFPLSDVRRTPADLPPSFPKPLPPPPSSSRVRSKSPLDPISLTSSTHAADVKSVDDPDWEWPALDMYEDKHGKIELRTCSENIADDVSPFQVMYRRRKHQLWPDLVQINLISAPLIKIAQKFLPRNGDLQSLASPTVSGRELFILLDDLKRHEVSACSVNTFQNENPQVDGEDKGGLHLKHLIRFMEKEYRDVSVRLRRMTEEKRVAWDMLWTFLTPGKKVVYTCDHTEEVLAAVVSKNRYSLIPNLSEWAFTVDLEVWNYDGRSYRKCQTQRVISKFDGECAFSSLAVRPIEVEGLPEILDEGFLANGKRFYELAVKNGHRFMQYSGPMFQLNPKKTEGYKGVVKENADGRVMIDLTSFARMNPGYQMGPAKPPVGTFREPVHDPFGRRIRFQESEEMLHVAQSCSETVTDESLIFAPAIVYGFSFTLKQWGSFAVSGFSEISFNTNSYDALVMEPDSKQLVYKLVSQYIATPVGPSEPLQRVDPIAHKGEGCIFLCYGPPGTGKTLTAESVAESMQRPLWSLSAAELGTTSSSLEKTMLEVLEIAATWRAVLLLDEADVFLEKRTVRGDLSRNAMTGVFLRFLEYYRGVLFLTTNRIGTFDNAFRSRISMFLRYPKLTIKHKQQVWMTLLERAGVKGITAEFVSEVATKDLNGREIRNSIHTAQILAKSNGETLDQSHVRHVTSVLVSTLTTLSNTMKSASEGNET